MKEVKNLLTPSAFNSLQREVFASEFNWNFIRTTFNGDDDMVNIDSNLRPYHSFMHSVIYDYVHVSPISKLLENIIYTGLDKMGEDFDRLIRVRINMLFGNHIRYTNPPHIDTETPHKAGLIYLNTTDGDTLLYNEKYDSKYGLYADEYYTKILKEKVTIKNNISCEENKMVCFDGLTYHSSTTPVNSLRRIVVNFNYTLK
jgi:hypothetical protein